MPDKTQVTSGWSHSQRSAHSAGVQPRGRRLQPGAPGLAVFVHIVVLDLAEIPVIAVEQALEHRGRAVETEPRLADLPGRFLFGQPLPHARGFELAPAFDIGQHVHEIIVDMVGAQAAQLLGKIALKVPRAAHKVLRQLAGDADAVAAVVAL